MLYPEVPSAGPAQTGGLTGMAGSPGNLSSYDEATTDEYHVEAQLQQLEARRMREEARKMMAEAQRVKDQNAAVESFDKYPVQSDLPARTNILDTLPEERGVEIGVGSGNVNDYAAMNAASVKANANAPANR